jgi:hypothetical protein
VLPLNAETRPPGEDVVLFTEMFSVNAAVDALPTESVNEPEATVITAVPPTD